MVVGMTLACGVQAAFAQEVARPKDNDWRITIAPYAWLTSLDGNVTVRGIKANADADFFDDILGDLSFAGMILAEVQKDRVAFNVNFVGARLESSNNNIDTKQDSVNLGLSAAYFLIDEPRSDDGGIGYRLAPLVGAHYTCLRAEIDVGNFRTVESNENWVDPIVGLRGSLDLSNRFAIAAEGDVGGFGVGSDFAWNGQIYGTYKTSLFGVSTNLSAGYRALSQDYDDGDFEYDVTTYGPIIGAASTF